LAGRAGRKTDRCDVDKVERRLRKEATMSGTEKITVSSGNLFEDLGIPNAVENKAKLRLALVINRVLEEQGLLQKDAAKLLGCKQSEISALANYKLRGLSVIRLLEFLTALDRDVEIAIRKTQGHGHIRVQELEPA
jgi:predicted XRE-type DNA-binding protein